MASLSDYLENKLLDHSLGTAAFTHPADVYVALFTAAPNDGGGGTEVTGGSYARVAATFSAAASGATSNSVAVTFPAATADWGTVVAIGIFDALTVGNLLWHGALTANRTVSTGTTFEIPIGDLDVTLA